MEGQKKVLTEGAATRCLGQRIDGLREEINKLCPTRNKQLKTLKRERET